MPPPPRRRTRSAKPGGEEAVNRFRAPGDVRAGSPLHGQPVIRPETGSDPSGHSKAVAGLRRVGGVQLRGGVVDTTSAEEIVATRGAYHRGPMLGSHRSRFVCALVHLALAALALVLIARDAHAADPPDPKTLPDALKPWTAWVLDGHDEALCPTFHEHADLARCLWPARLELTLDEHGGRFAQSWHADTRGWVPVPGDAKRWPSDVKIDGKPAVVVETSGAPTVRLERGDHEVTGAFAWDSLPDSLHVPPETGLLALILRGAPIATPNRDAQGTVWLQKAATNDEGNALEVIVHRKITDDIPLLVTTRIELHVAGKSREELLGKALLPGFVPMSLGGALPARLEPDGRLRVQVRPGIFVIELGARSEAVVNALTRAAPEGPWREGEEVWVFEARNDYRVVTLGGATSIDPQQTTLPDAWKRLPAYAMKVGDTLTFTEKRRGDADPPPNQLTLARTLWLDFDGTGYTASDTVKGTLTRDSRLAMAPPTVLGRVAIGGKDQFITHLGDPTHTGVEVRQGTLNVSADSRIPGDPGDIPAVSWAHDFHQVSGTLHLPPGWRLLHASGVDEVPGTWVRHWSLLELFLALIIAIAIGKLHGARWGVVALVMLALTFPEDGAPKWSWIAVLVAEALFRVLPAGRAKAFFSGVRVAAVVLVIVIVVPFLVKHVREGIYPTLANADSVVGMNEIANNVEDGEGRGLLDATKTADLPQSAGAPAPSVLAPAAPKAEPAENAPADDDKAGKAGEAVRRKALPSQQILGALGGSTASTNGWANDYRQSNAEVYDPASIVQTGPGLPRWTWSTLELRWSGPVTAGQRLHLVLLSPVENLILALVRAALLVLLLVRLLPWTQRIFPRAWGPAAAAMAAALVVLAPHSAQAQAVPSKELLDDLQARLLRKAECLPSCASSGRLAIDVRGGMLRARLEVSAAAPTAIPLPGRTPQWSPAHVVLDGQPARGLVRLPDGTLWIEIAPGPHQIVLEGPVPDGASMQLALPMKPHRVEATTAGWTVAGIHEDGLADDDLQLTRLEAKEADTHGALQPEALPPFVRVERTLRVGLDWQVETHVVRVTPTGSAIVLEVPLLAGESVTTADVRVVGGKAQVNLGPNATELVWRSVLEQKSPVKLAAPRSIPWVEVWRVDVGPIWHASYAGIPFVHTQPAGAVQVPEWRPWPGEEASVALTRPDGVPGQTLTIDQSTTDVTPGLRATDVSLALSIRSSRGAEHTITLPDGAQLESLTINGATQPIRQDGRKVTIPVVPGAQQVALAWRETQAIAPSFTASSIDLGAPSVNATMVIHVPGARWLLLTGGPRVGPAVLFWSLLLVLLVVSLGLGQNRWTPLRARHWLLFAIGLSQVDIVAGAIVVGWLLALGWRGRNPGEGLKPLMFDLRQIVLAVWTLLALILLCSAVYQGLLGSPAMQVRGNGSSSDTLRWFVDRTDAALPTPWMISVPLLVYRAAMLAWALWLALSLLGWVRWGWGALTTGGGWKKSPPRPRPVVAPPVYGYAYPLGAPPPGYPQAPMPPPPVAPSVDTTTPDASTRETTGEKKEP